MIGLKLLGDVGLFFAEHLGISLTAAAFQLNGMFPSASTLVKNLHEDGWLERWALLQNCTEAQKGHPLQL